MIVFDHVTISYPDAARPVLSNVDLRLAEGELCLVAGRTGSGKSTLLGAINGLVPHFTGGHLRGRITVDGIDTASAPPRDFAHVVGVVGQDPLAGFVTDTVAQELAYGMEQLAIAPDVMRKRVEEVLDVLGIAELRDRPLRTLSGGQQQRVAIGSVLTAQPRVLVLDEPTSALDPTAAEDVLATVTRLVHDLAITVVVAEHRMERVVQYADRLVYLPGGGRVVDGPPAEVLAACEITPPVVELAKLAGWSPLPTSVRDARRQAVALRARLKNVPPPEPEQPHGKAAMTAQQVVVRYGAQVAVRAVDIKLRSGEIAALMGRNGAGKSSLLWALQGSGPRQGGTVRTADGVDPGAMSARKARAAVGLVPQTASDLLYLETVAAECRESDRESGAEPGTCRRLLDRIAGGIGDDQHPRDLSEGQRLALVLAIQLTAAPPVMLLDEPTRGLDYHAKRSFGAIVRELAAAGHAVLLSTHDVEFVAAVADRVLVMADGDVVADGRTADIVVSSPAFAPQIAKVMHPQRWLTVDQLRGVL